VVALEEGNSAREERHRRPGADWIYMPAFASRAQISKATIFPMSEFNPKGDFLDVYWLKARYYRANDPTAYTIERMFVYDQGRIENEEDVSRWDEYGAIKGAVEHVIADN